MKENKWTPYVRAMLTGFCTIALSVLFFFFLFRMQSVSELLHEVGEILAPFVYGAVIAYLLRPMCNAYDNGLQKILPKPVKKLSNGLAVMLSLITGLLIVYALIIMVAPQLVESIETIWSAIPDRIDQFYNWAVGILGGENEILQFINNNADTIYAEVEKWASENLAPQFESIQGVVGNLLGGVGTLVSGVGMSVLKVIVFLKNLIIGLIVAVYLLGSRKRFARQGKLLVHSLFRPRWAEMILKEVAFVDEMFSGFIDGKLVDSGIIGVLCYIGCLIFKFPNALLVSAIVGITNVIPFFGPFIGAVPATLLIMIESPIKGLWFILFVIVLQQLDGNIIGPKILGDRTGLSSFWVLFSIVLGGGLWGLAGMVVCVPLFAVIYDIIKKLVHIGLKKHGREDLWQNYNGAAPAAPPEPPAEEAEKTE